MKSAHPLIRLAGAAVLALLPLTSCQMLDLDAMDTTQLSNDAVVLGVPVLYQDELYECGLATVSALCQYHDSQIPPDERQRLIQIAEREEGLSGAELRETLDSMGLHTFIFRGSLDESLSGLYYHIDRGRPLLVMISEDGASHHYCLAIGYDETTDTVVVLDPRRGDLVFPTAAFENLWSRSDYFSLLCVPDGPETPTKTS